MDFKSQYKHPYWQKKRLEVLDHYGFKCQSCDSEDATIHVHHRRYIKGRMIWDYPVTNFDVLCEVCHAETHQAKDLLMEVIATIPAMQIEAAANLLAGWSRHFDNDDVVTRCFDAHSYAIGVFASIAIDYQIGDLQQIAKLSPDSIAELSAQIRGMA